MQIVYENRQPVIRLTATEKKKIQAAKDVFSLMLPIEPYKAVAQAAIEAIDKATESK